MSAVLPGMREMGLFTGKTEDMEREAFLLPHFPIAYEFNLLAIF